MRGLGWLRVLGAVVLAAPATAAAQQVGAGPAGEATERAPDATGAAATVAPADPADSEAMAEARDLFERGTRLMQNENWDMALVELERSYERYPMRSALFNLAMCHKALHRYRAALARFDEWQDRFAEAASEDERLRVARAQEELRQYVGFLVVESEPPGATVVVDREEHGTTPQERPLGLDIGRHQLDVSLEGYVTSSRDVVVVPLETVRVTVALERERPATAGLGPGPQGDGSPATVEADAGVDEPCDDGNEVPGDGCDLDCTFSCTALADCDATCAWGSCVVTAAETCNSADDDCDTVLDDGFACTPDETEPCTVGSCAGTRTCTSSCTWGTCVAGSTETCNGVDDDCDGTTDEGFDCALGATESCTTACATDGSRTCETGCTWGACCAGVETCGNDCDDDCDGLTDERCGGAIPCADDGPCTVSGLVCNENWGICVVASCVGRDDFTPCETVTAPDRSYDICVGGTCVSPGCGTASCNAPGPNWTLADTGQRTCYDATAALASCPGTPGTSGCEATAFCGQDAQYGWDVTHLATERFTRTTDAQPVVTDNVTGLMWQGCSRGQSGSDCSGTASPSNWSTALSDCDDLTWGGHSDWRLPDDYELQSIVDHGVSSGARIDPAAFPATVATSFYWSSSSFAANASNAWSVTFSCGDVASIDKTNTPPYVRCVRRGS
ncbi:MAG: DUF1566 domain-containing protein [Deltaproteobacteria bacterium]|nr:DUF1566 domain-containing protein [Deltaproteobacteria bacterium]